MAQLTLRASWGSWPRRAESANAPLLCPPGPLPLLPSPAGQVRPGSLGALATSLCQDPGDPGTLARPTTAADCIPRPRRRAPPTLTRAFASRSGPAAPAGSRAPLARGDQAAHAVDEPARAASLGPPRRSPTATRLGSRCRGRRSGGLRGGGGRWWVGVGERRVSWDWPGRAATAQHRGAESGFQGAGTARAEPVFAPKGTGHGAKGPRAAGSGSFTAASSCPARTWRPPGSRVPATPGARARGPCAHVRLYSLRGHGPCLAEPLT